MSKWVGGIKNHSTVIGSAIALAFLLIVIFTYRKSYNDDFSRNKHLQKTVAYTIGCTKNIRSSMHDVDYKFVYKSQFYFGSEKFNKNKHGDICKGYRFIVEFDSTDPRNNKILLDSMIKTNPIYDDRFK